MGRGPLVAIAAAVAMIVLATSAQAGVGAAAAAPIMIILDGQDISAGLPVRVEQGSVLMPVRNLAQALGASLYWEGVGEGTGIVHLYSYPRMFSPLGLAPAQIQRSQPAYLGAVGAASALTQYLAAEQAVSLSGAGPAMVRFELLDLMAWWIVPPPEDLTLIDADGYVFAVRQYYVKFKDQTAPAYASQWRRLFVSGGGPAVGGFVPEVTTSWYEDFTINVRPKGSPTYTKNDESEVVTYGLDGWEVDPASRTLLQKVAMDRTPYVIHGSFGR